MTFQNFDSFLALQTHARLCVTQHSSSTFILSTNTHYQQNTTLRLAGTTGFWWVSLAMHIFPSGILSFFDSAPKSLFYTLLQVWRRLDAVDSGWSPWKSAFQHSFWMFTSRIHVSIPRHQSMTITNILSFICTPVLRNPGWQFLCRKPSK